HEHALRKLDANVRFARARGDVPVDATNVVARNVRTDLRELGAVAEQDGAVVPGEQSLHPLRDRHVERAQQRIRERPGAGAFGGRSRVQGSGHAALVRARSIFGCGTAAITASRMVSALTSSASAWYVRTRVCRSASLASSCRSSAST